MNKEILKRIDKEIKSIWENDIPLDYEEKWLLREDTLKNVLYFHLRTRLGQLFDKNNIRYIQNLRRGFLKKADIDWIW